MSLLLRLHLHPNAGGLTNPLWRDLYLHPPLGAVDRKPDKPLPGARLTAVPVQGPLALTGSAAAGVAACVVSHQDGPGSERPAVNVSQPGSRIPLES